MELPRQAPCYFCEIAQGRGDAWLLLERADLTMTVLNGRQFETGQCMIVPLRHAPTILDLRPEEEAAVMAVVPRRPGSDWGFGPPHLARQSRPPAHDHTAATELKRQTAELLRAQFAASIER